MSGTSGNPITFQNYPGERATIDGNYDNSEVGNAIDTMILSSSGQYVYLRGVEVMNSQTNRLCQQGGAPPDCRGEGVQMAAPFSKVINCIIHDCGEGIGLWGPASGGEAYGNIIYYNGFIQPTAEPDCGDTIDLAPAGGSAVTTTGSPATGSTVDTSLTFSFNHTGDCVVVGVFVAIVTGTTDYTDVTATYNGVSMNLINGYHNSIGSQDAATFVLSNGQGAATGTHNVVISYPASARLRGIAQSFVNVDQASPASEKGGWVTTWLVPGQMLTLPPYLNTVASATNHLLVDTATFWNTTIDGTPSTYAETGDPATIIGSAGDGNGLVYMSSSPGAASVDMGWTWTTLTTGGGHGIYTQAAKLVEDAVSTDTSYTLTSASNPWLATDVGSTLVVEGAGVAGGLLNTTISGFNSAGSITMADAASTTASSERAKWAPGSTIKHNIFYDQLGYGIQAYGTSDAAFLGSDITENVFAYGGVILGGLSSFWLTDSTFDGNCQWQSSVNIGYHTTNLTNFAVTDNVLHENTTIVDAGDRGNVSITGNSIVGTTGVVAGDFPTNTWYADPPLPDTNVVVVCDNAYEANRANIYVYNWDNSTSVNVDLDGVVANGTPIFVLNAQDYYNTPVVTTTYQTGTPVSIPMTGLTAASAVGTDFTPIGPTGQGFNCFIVRAQSEETWR